MGNHNKQLIKPLSLALLAFVLYCFQESTVLFVIAVLIASAVSIVGLLKIISAPKTIQFSSILAVSILLGYGLGSAIFLVANQTFDAPQIQYWAYQGLHFNQAGLSTGLAVSLFAAAALYELSKFQRSAYFIYSSDSMAGSKPERLVWFGVGLIALALYTGEIGYQGAIVSETRNISPLGAIANLMVPPLVPYVLLLILSRRSPIRKMIFLAALLFLVGTLFVTGRRNLLYAIVLAGIAWHMSGYKLTKNIVITTIISFFVVIVLYFGFSFFLVLRGTVGDLGVNASLLDLVSSSVSRLFETQGGGQRAMLAENIGYRPFILSYFGGLIGIASNRIPTFGAELIYSLQMSIPSILMPSKVASLASLPEGLIHPLYGIRVFDGPNSLLVAGFDDFGLIGAVLYPVAVAILYGLFFRSFRALIRDPAIVFFILFALSFELLNIEQALAATFVTLRDLTIVAGVASLLNIFPVFSVLSQRTQRSGRV